MKLEDTIRTIPDFPKPGILFRDVTTLFKNPEAFHQLISDMAEELKDKHVDVVVGPEVSEKEPDCVPYACVCISVKSCLRGS